MTYVARAAVLGALAKLDPAAARPLLQEALMDRDWAVRVRARALLAEQGVTGVDDAMRPAVAGQPVDSAEWQAIVSPRFSPRAFIDTDKGTVELELAVLDAPLTVANFITLARKGSSTALRSTASCPTSSSRTATRAGTAKAGQATRFETRSTSTLPARDRRHGARLAGHRRKPVLHHAFTPAASGRPIHRLRAGRERDGCRGSPGAGRCGAAGESAGRGDSGLSGPLPTPRVLEVGSRGFVSELSLLRRLLLRALSLLCHVNPPLRLDWIAISPQHPGHSAAWHVGPDAGHLALRAHPDVRDVRRAATRGQKKWGAPSSTP